MDLQAIKDLAEDGRVWYCVAMDGSARGKPHSSAVWGQDLARHALDLKARLEAAEAAMAKDAGATRAKVAEWAARVCDRIRRRYTGPGGQSASAVEARRMAALAARECADAIRAALAARAKGAR